MSWSASNSRKSPDSSDGGTPSRRREERIMTKTKRRRGGAAAAEGAAGGRSQRQLRVGEEIRHALSQLLLRGELRDPELAGVSVTVSEVRVSPDLRQATAFVLPLGGANAPVVVAALNRAAPFLRAQVARQMRLKFAPTVDFRLDTSFETAARLEELLRRPGVAADLAAEDEEGDDG
jgi:ribosome-binding factor A